MDEVLDATAQAGLEAARQPFLILDHEMRILAANPSFCASFRVSLEDILGKSLGGVCDCSWKIPKLEEALKALPMADISFDDIEVEADLPAVGRRIMRLNARVVHPGLSPEPHTVLSIEDITERILAEKALRDSELRFRTLFETSQDGILLVDAESGRIEQANPFMARLMGRTLADLEGRELGDLGFFQSVDAFRDAFARIRETGSIRFEDLPLRSGDGRTLEVEFVCNRYVVGGREWVQCNVRDVSERKRAERAVLEAERKLQQSHKMEAIGTLAGGMAHEYNNLLTAIKGYTDLALAEAGTVQPMHGHLAEIAHACDRAATLTQQLLAYSRRQILAPQLVDPNALLTRIYSFVERLVSPKNIDLEKELEPGIGLIKVDPVQIEQALLNLVLNAREAMPRGGRLTLKTAKTVLERTDAPPQSAQAGEFILLAISDTGPGLTQEAQARIFDPFYAPTNKRIGGLGLSMVQGVVTQSGGFIATESAPGQGTTFRLFLPHVRNDPAPER